MIEKQEPENWLGGFEKDSTPNSHDFGYVPLPTNVQGEPEGSVYAAHLRQENTIGSMLNRTPTQQLSEDVRDSYDFTNYANKIPKDLIPYADKFFGATTDDEFDTIEKQLRQELGDKALLTAHPWKALAYAFDPLEPTNWIPGGVIYKEAKIGAAITRSFMGASLSAIASTGIQEAILHQNQLTRTAQESIFNVVGAGVLGGVIGGSLSAFGSRKLAKAGEAFDVEAYKSVQRAQVEVNNALNPNEALSAAKSKILDDAEIARMPAFIQKTMKLTPMNRLLTSPFKTAKWFGSAAYEHNYELTKNASGIASDEALETQIKNEMRLVQARQIDHMNFYYEMHGVTGKYFKGTRKKLAELGTQSPENLSLTQFNQAVYEATLTGEQHALPQVNKAANMWREQFDRLKDDAVALDLLPPDVTVPNAANYIMIRYNKNKIIEEGGKSARGQGTFANHLFEQFQASNESVKQFMDSPAFTNAQAQIKELNERIKRLPPEKMAEINTHIADIGKKVKALEALKTKRPKEQLDKINNSIKALDEKRATLAKDIAERQAHHVAQIQAEIKSHAKGAIDYKGRVKKNRAKAESLQNKIAAHVTKVGELKGRIKEIKGETPKKERLQIQLEAAQEAAKDLREEGRKLSDLIKQDEGFIKSHDKRTVELADIAKHPERHVPELRKKLKDIEDEIAKAHESKKPTHAEIRAHEKAIRELEKEKKAVEKSREIPTEEKKKFAEEIERLEKQILDDAPANAKTWEGKLHNVIEGNGVEEADDLLWNQVEQTIDHILGDADGQLLNPHLAGIGANTKPFKARKLIIDQLQASPWHVTDIQQIAESYTRAMIPAIKMQAYAKRHGYKDINDFVNGVGESLRKEFDAASQGVTGKKAQDIRKQYESNLVDMRAAIEQLQGVYGQGFNVLNSKGAQFFNNVLSWNYSRMLGHMTLASLPDLGLVVMRNGLMETLAHGIGESFSLVKTISKNDLRAIGYGIETELAGQFKNYLEHQGLSTNPSPFTRGLESLTRTFGNLSLMNPWQDMIQNMSGHIAINKILTIIHKIEAGKKVTKKETTNLARLGIGQEHFADIAKFTKDNVYKGTRFADWTNWDIKTPSEGNALKSFQAAVSKSINEIAIIPNFGDKPLTLSQKGLFGTMSKLMFQFKSFMFAATNRILYSGIQNRGDINLYMGAVSMMGLGMLGYVSSSFFRGSEPDLSTKNILREGLDRSGLLGVFGEGINIGQKLFQLGEVSRYKSRDAFGSVLGPTGGSASELVQLFNKLNPFSSAKGEWTTKDAEAVMRLMPLQNLFYLQRISRGLTHNIAEGLGATPVID